MKIIYNDYLPFKGFIALNLFGIIFIRNDQKDWLNKHSQIEPLILNHEAIHTAQMKETLYIGFYIIYFIWYLFNLVRHDNSITAYRAIPFEREAYNNEADMDYLKTRKHFSFLHYVKDKN